MKDYRKLAEILIEECRSVEERCEGYRSELIDVVGKIIQAEEQHQVKGTYIQQKVHNFCDELGNFLVEERNMEEEPAAQESASAAAE